MKPATRATKDVSNAFAGFTEAPTVKQLREALGASKPLWDRLVQELAADLGLQSFEWNTSAPKRGWSFRVKQGDRIIVYLVPHKGGFHANVVLGHRALNTALDGGLPASAVQLLKNASKCAVGTGVRLPVESPADIVIAKKLAAAKLKT